MARFKIPDYDRLDDVDIYVQSTPMTPEEEKRLSELLKARREKDARRTSLHSVPKTPKRTKAASR